MADPHLYYDVINIDDPLAKAPESAVEYWRGLAHCVKVELGRLGFTAIVLDGEYYRVLSAPESPFS